MKWYLFGPQYLSIGQRKQFSPRATTLIPTHLRGWPEGGLYSIPCWFLVKLDWPAVPLNRFQNGLLYELELHKHPNPNAVFEIVYIKLWEKSPPLGN